ncbi:enamelin isoform X2 [Syngnathoides biaculeatus]|uniref:enamelin isoform X2 n=1 Tax=Syngnathoides biaculeatus TaxID=300417 RepID=UPI002ADD8CC4|nr:enamelin isoform X2 [Syngnathoides biaculeatus]
MERAVVMCLFVACSAAPLQESQSNEQIAAHANQALRLMEMYRLYQQQGLAVNPFLPAAATPRVRAAAKALSQVDAAPAQAATAAAPLPPAAPAAAAQPVGEDASEEEEL